LKEKEYKEKIKKYGLLTMLGLTRVLEKADYTIPLRYDSMIDSLRVSCGLLHERLSFVDKEVEQEFREKEEMINLHLGNEKFYDDEEINKLQEKMSKSWN